MNPGNLPPGFSEFWGKYPRKVGKGQAARAWVKNGGAENLQAILKDLKSRRRPDDPQYIPHPSTYLNGWRWLDSDMEEESSGDW